MAYKIPPQPIGSVPGSGLWNDWIEKLRTAFNDGQVGVVWSNIDFSGSNITDLVSRSHQGLQNLQGGTAGEMYHLSQADYTLLTALPTLASSTYTPTLTNVANLDGSTAYSCQYLRVGSVVTVSGKVDVNPTAAGVSTQLGISLPIASNFGAQENCGGTANCPSVAGMSAAILGDTANDRAQLQFVSSDVNNNSMYFTFTYRII